MRKKDKLKSMETANKRLLGESIPDEIQDRLSNLKSQYGLKDSGDDCKEIAFKLWNHLTLQEYGELGNPQQNRSHFEQMWDWYSKNDEDFYNAGNEIQY